MYGLWARRDRSMQLISLYRFFTRTYKPYDPQMTFPRRSRTEHFQNSKRSQTNRSFKKVSLTVSNAPKIKQLETENLRIFMKHRLKSPDIPSLSIVKIPVPRLTREGVSTSCGGCGYCRRAMSSAEAAASVEGPIKNIWPQDISC